MTTFPTPFAPNDREHVIIIEIWKENKVSRAAGSASRCTVKTRRLTNTTTPSTPVVAESLSSHMQYKVVYPESFFPYTSYQSQASLCHKLLYFGYLALEHLLKRLYRIIPSSPNTSPLLHPPHHVNPAPHRHPSLPLHLLPRPNPRLTLRALPPTPHPLRQPPARDQLRLLPRSDLGSRLPVNRPL